MNLTKVLVAFETDPYGEILLQTSGIGGKVALAYLIYRVVRNTKFQIRNSNSLVKLFIRNIYRYILYKNNQEIVRNPHSRLEAHSNSVTYLTT